MICPLLQLDHAIHRLRQSPFLDDPTAAYAMCARDAQLQQEGLQHATALQGLAQRADAAASQMHDLQRLMEAMQGVRPLSESPCCGNSGFWSAVWLVLAVLLGPLQPTVCSVTLALHLAASRRRRSQHFHACPAAVPDLCLLGRSGVIKAVCGPAASAATLAVRAVSASAGVATRDDRRAASGASVSGAGRSTCTMSGVTY